MTGPDHQLFNTLQAETSIPWGDMRHDAFTFRVAMAQLASHRPRVLYLALGETDDWAHDGRYDRVLEAYARSDAYLAQLWTWLQSQPDYKGSTHILITTDHGRGRTAKDWRDHGAKIEGAQDVWMAFASPAMARRGRVGSAPTAFDKSGRGDRRELGWSRLESDAAARWTADSLSLIRVS